MGPHERVLLDDFGRIPRMGCGEADPVPRGEAMIRRTRDGFFLRRDGMMESTRHADDEQVLCGTSWTTPTPWGWSLAARLLEEVGPRRASSLLYLRSLRREPMMPVSADDEREHEWENRRTKEGYLVAQCVKCGYWLWETFHGIPPVPAHNDRGES